MQAYETATTDYNGRETLENEINTYLDSKRATDQNREKEHHND